MYELALYSVCSVFWGSLTAQALHASSAPRRQNALGRNRCDFPYGLAWRIYLGVSFDGVSLYLV